MFLIFVRLALGARTDAHFVDQGSGAVMLAVPAARYSWGTSRVMEGVGSRSNSRRDFDLGQLLRICLIGSWTCVEEEEQLLLSACHTMKTGDLNKRNYYADGTCLIADVSGSHLLSLSRVCAAHCTHARCGRVVSHCACACVISGSQHSQRGQG